MTHYGKTFRYYRWLFVEFVRKHSKMIFLSFFLSLLVILSVLSFSSQLDAVFFSNKRVVGIVGTYDTTSLPEEVLSNISYGLVYTDTNGIIRPAVAQSWKGTPDAKKFTVKLKENLIWDDNKALTTNDLTFNFQDIEMKKINNHEMEFDLKRPLDIFPTYLTKPLIRYPLHGVVGNYKVKKIKSNQENKITELVLTPNKKDLDNLTYKFYDSESKMINAYKLGEITEMKIYKKSVAETFKTWRNTQVEKNVDYTTVLTLFFNLKKPEFADKDFRKNVSLAIPRSTLAEFGELAEGPIPPTSWAYNSNLKKSLYDPEEAKKQLSTDESASKAANFTIVTYYDYLNQANILEEGLKKAGLPVELNLGYTTDASNFDMLLAFWKLPVDPDQYFFWHSTQTKGGNITGLRNVRIDKLLEDGRKTLDPTDRKKEYVDFQKILADELPAAFLYYPYSYTVVRK